MGGKPHRFTAADRRLKRNKSVPAYGKKRPSVAEVRRANADKRMMKEITPPPARPAI